MRTIIHSNPPRSPNGQASKRCTSSKKPPLPMPVPLLTLLLPLLLSSLGKLDALKEIKEPSLYKMIVSRMLEDFAFLKTLTLRLVKWVLPLLTD